MTFKILIWHLNWGQISYFDIQKIYNMVMFWKSWILTFRPPVLAGGGGWGVGGQVCWQNISYHVAAFVIPFNLICSMTMFWRTWKFWILSFWPHPLSPPRGLDRCLWSKIMFDMFHNYCTSVCMWQLSKTYWQLTELLQNLNIWHLTPPKGSRGGVIFNHCPVYLRFGVMLILFHKKQI